MLGTSYLVYHTCYTLCMCLSYVNGHSWMISMVKIMPLRVDVHSHTKVTRRKSISRVRAVCMRLRRDNNIRKRSCFEVVIREWHWPCSWCTLQSPGNLSIVGWLRSGTHQVSELPFEAVHLLLAVAQPWQHQRVQLSSDSTTDHQEPSSNKK